MGLRLSSAQEGIWFAHQRDPGARRYTCAEYLVLDGPLDVAALRRAWSVLAAAADAVRVERFVEDAATGRVTQVIGPDVPELREVEVDGEAEAAAWMAADLDTPVDLADGPVSRFALLHLGAHRHFWYLRMHHAVTDAHSMHLLQSTLAGLYGDIVEGREPAVTLTPLGDLVAADDAYRAGADFAADGGYWAKRFADCPAPPRLPADPPAPGEDRPVRVRHTAAVSAAAAGDLLASAAELGTTWQVVLIAATAAYTQRVTGRRDVVLGLPVSGRRGPSRRAPGMAAGTVALRLEVAPSATLRGLLPAVAEEIRSAQRHERYRHEDLCRALGLSVAEGGLLGPMINFMPYARDLRFGDVTATAHNLSAGPTIDVTLGVRGAADTGLSLVVDANPDLHRPASAARQLAGWAAFTGAVAADPDRAFGSVDVLTADERADLLVRRNDTARPRDAETVVDLLRRNAERHPDAPAVTDGAREITYAELDAAATALASRLAEAGVRREDVVALALPRSTDLVVAMLGVLRAGACYLPLDLSYPAARIAFMLADCLPRCVITDDTDDTAYPGLAGLPRIRVHDRPHRTMQSTGPDLDTAAYLIYTSGSTGSPKGVVVPHGALANLALDHRDRFGLGVGKSLFQYVSPAFDAAVADIWTALVAGARLVLAPEPTAVTFDELVARLRADRITHAAFPPAVLAKLPAGRLPDLEVLVVGGEPTDPRLVRRWGGDRRMMNMYGPTEVGVTATGARLAPDRPASIGGPIENVAVYVLDGDSRPVPPGAAGELHVAGAGLARGYLNQPAMTAERFMPCPFGPPGTRMYRTGDLVRWLPDATLEYLGRADDQVKIRGFRVQLGEIESALARDPRVLAAVVAARGAASRRLVAYVVPRPGTRLDPAVLRAALREVLPEFMVPASVVVLAELPLQPNGKVDRRALPQQADDAPADPAPRAAGRVGTLCALVADVLGVAEIGPHESFFDRGGDSILALQLVSRAHAAGLVLTSREVFQNPTAAQLAELARAADGEAAEAPGAGLGELPAPPMTRWALDHGPIDGFHQAVRIRVPAGARLADLETVWQAVVDHHQAFHARLQPGPDPALVVGPPTPNPLSRVDHSEPVAGQLAAAAAELAPEKGVLVRAVWFDAGPSTPGTLLVVAHHLAVDGVSWRILLDDLAAAWAAVASGETPRLTPVGTSLRTWARELAAAASLPRWTGQAGHWRDVLGTEDPPVGCRDLDPAVDTFATAATTARSLPPALAEPVLTALPAAYRATANDVLLTALARAVGRWRPARATAVLLDLEGHGRERAGLDRTLGWFTSLYPVRLDPGPADTEPGAALKRVKEQLRAVPDSGVGFGMLRRLNPATAETLTKTPRLAFNYLGRLSTADSDWALAGDDPFCGAADPRMAMPHALELNAIAYDRDSGPDLRLLAAWPSGALAADEVAALLDLWQAELTALVAAGGSGLTPSDVPLTGLSQDELDAITDDHPDATEILPLTPLQGGLLLHNITAGSSVDVYGTQIRVTLDGDVSARRLRAAAAEVLRRHPNLGAAFRYADVDEPVQVIGRGGEVPLAEHDLSAVAEPERSARADRLAGAHRAERFELDRPPLLRLLLVRLGPDRHELAVTAHHILWDGWSISLVLRDLFACYAGTALPEPPRLRDYLAWLSVQDRDGARAAWAAALAGLDGPTLVAPGPPAAPVANDRASTLLTERCSAALGTLGVTLNSLAQVVWALLLAERTGRDDIVFGTSVSGRPPELPGVHDMVGLLTNTIPVRVRLRPEESLIEAARRVQAEQASLLAHHHLGLDEVQRQSPCGRVLFDTTAMVVNYPFATADWAAGPDAPRATGYAMADDTHFPLRLVVVPGPRIELRLYHRPDVVGAAEAARLLDAVAAALSAAADHPEVTVSELKGFR